jgi:hypothetical protein
MSSDNNLILGSVWTWLVCVVVVATVLGLLRWFSSAGGWLISAGILLLGALMLVLWWVLYRRSSAYRRALHAMELQARHLKAEQLEEALQGLGLPQAATHVRQLTEKLDAFVNVLKMRFSESEMTYHRYLGVATQLYDGAFRNLESLQASGSSIKAINPQRLQAHITDLDLQGRGDSRESLALKERYKVYNNQLSQVEKLTAQNEEALTALSDTTSALASVDTNTQSLPDMESVIDNLRRLAQRVDAYGVKV